jgi:para-nitrobenzyl esterase
VPLAEAERIGKEFLDKAGVHSIGEAKRLDARAIYEIYNESKRFGFPPVVDGYFLTKTLPETFAAHEQAQVPLLVGWNSAEISGSGFMHDKPYREAEYVAQMKETFPHHAEELLKLYPHGSPEEIERSATALASDRFIAYSTYRWFDLQRKNSSQPVYRYLYSKLRPPMRDDTLAANPSGGGTLEKPAQVPAPKAIGAPHACEIEYCLGNLPLVHDYAWTADDFKVSRTMQDYFANFIKTGNPNGEGLPDWPAAAPADASPPVMVIDTVSSLKRADTDARYAALEKAFADDAK